MTPDGEPAYQQDDVEDEDWVLPFGSASDSVRGEKAEFAVGKKGFVFFHG